MATSAPNSSTGRLTRARTVGRPESFYPSPFFDIAQNYIPKTIQETFEWCTYYQLTNPLVSTVTSRLAAYPMTDLIYKDSNEGVVAKWRHFFETICGMRLFSVEMNLDRYTFGNAFCTVAFPFIKKLICKACGTSIEAEKAKENNAYKWRNFRFHLQCASCAHVGVAKVKDDHVKNAEKIRLVRWNPRDLVIDYNPITGKKRYYYKMPRFLRNQITLGVPDVVHNVPQAFIEAMRQKRGILIDGDRIFHARRAAISRSPSDSGWGAPLILPVLKDIFFTQILRKSQEAVALEHIVPMRVLFPQVSTDGNNVFANVNLKDWQKEVETQVSKWRQDPNHIPIVPFPMGYQLIGGQGRSLLLHQELRVYYDQIIAGMGVPTSFFYGEAQYSGASVNLRALENEFLGNRIDMLRLVIFVRDQVARFMGWPVIEMMYRPFKMADDIQRSSFDLNLANAGYISRSTMLQAQNFDYATEQRLIADETKQQNKFNRENTIAQAQAQGEAMLIQTKFQIQSQQEQQAAFPQPVEGQQPGQPGQAQPGQPQQGQPQQGQPQQGQDQPQQGQEGQPAAAGGQEPVQGMAQSPITAQNGGSMIDLMAQARQVSRMLNAMDETDKYTRLQELRASNPDLYTLVVSDLGKKGQGTASTAPLPEQRPPRAAPDRAQI